MAAIAHHSLELTRTDPWRAVVSASVGWAEAQGLDLRDTVVLLPFAQLLPLARRAFGATGGWMPRIETTQSLGRSLGPPEPPAPGQLSFDVALDRLVAERMLRAQPWARNDVRGFAHWVAQVVDTAHALARAAFAMPAAQRPEHWERGRALLTLQSLTPGLPGTTERLLGRVALEWAANAPAPATDNLFALRPAAWIALQAGGPDPLTRRLLLEAAPVRPCLCLDADVDPEDPFAQLPADVTLAMAVSDDFEDEAQRSAACVLQHLQRGEQPLALIAQDRLLVRRVRALLARQGVAMRDETGWTLSTTRGGASVRSVLSCVKDDASSDDWVEWLKSCPALCARAGSDALDSLERALRENRLRLARSVDPAALAPAAAALWRLAQQALSPLALGGPTAAAPWLSALDATLRASGLRAALEADDAGRQVLATLRLAPQSTSEGAAPDSEMLDLDSFTAWLDTALEQATYLPEFSDAAQVVITPLARAMLRPFAAVVFPGANDRTFGVAPAANGLLSDREAAALGAPDRQARRHGDVLGFTQLLRCPNLTLLHRITDDGEPCGASPWVELLRLSLRRVRPEAWKDAPDARVLSTLAPTPTERPLPCAPSLLPKRLSASACEALRTCPYRFFALRMLKLKASDELDAALEKREYGTWLHAVLQRFHAQRTEPGSAIAEAAQLHAIGRDVLREQRLDEAEFLPYSASFSRLVPHYLAWLHRRDAAGAKWLDAEIKLSAQPGPWGDIEMQGVIDRVDFFDQDGVPTTQLIDYKTGQAQPLRDAIKLGEDTQLAFYAALMAAQGDAPGDLGAMYLMLDEADKLQELAHDDVQTSARVLVDGIGHDLARLRAGAALPALGEGRACESCDARGLCRRDHWPGSSEAVQ